MPKMLLQKASDKNNRLIYVSNLMLSFCLTPTRESKSCEVAVLHIQNFGSLQPNVIAFTFQSPNGSMNDLIV